MRLRTKRKVALICILIAVVLITVLIIFNNAILPSVMEISEASIKNLAIMCMNEAVNEALAGVATHDLLNIVKDDQGNIVMIQSNTLKINDIATKTAMKTQENINALGAEGLSIPVGTIIGGAIFTGKGFPVIVDIVPLGAVTAKFSSEFLAAGINQTKHKVYLDLYASVMLVIGGSSKTVEVTNQVLISESIIIGNVPNTYLESGKPEILNLSP